MEGIENITKIAVYWWERYSPTLNRTRDHEIKLNIGQIQIWPYKRFFGQNYWGCHFLGGGEGTVNNNLPGKQLNHISACKWRKNHMASSKSFHRLLWCGKIIYHVSLDFETLIICGSQNHQIDFMSKMCFNITHVFPTLTSYFSFKYVSTFYS